jgi:hypothetical protein
LKNVTKASHYWQFEKLRATGQCICETLANAREFFLQKFSAIDELAAEEKTIVDWRNSRFCGKAETKIRKRLGFLSWLFVW